MSTRVRSTGSAEPAIVVVEDASLTAFYKDMTVPERRTFWACAAGRALEGMDFMIYPLVIGTIIKDEETRRRVLVDNAHRLYGFPSR